MENYDNILLSVNTILTGNESQREQALLTLEAISKSLLATNGNIVIDIKDKVIVEKLRSIIDVVYPNTKILIERFTNGLIG
jgi:hypothetical protein